MHLGFATGEVNLQGTQEPPHMLLIDVARFGRNQSQSSARTRLAANAAKPSETVSTLYFGDGARSRFVAQPAKPSPLKRPPHRLTVRGHRANRGCNRPRRATLGSQQNNPGSNTSRCSVVGARAEPQAPSTDFAALGIIPWLHHEISLRRNWVLVPL
jgi:hypothetical protein